MLIYIRYARKSMVHQNILSSYTSGHKMHEMFRKCPKFTFKALFSLSDKLDIGLPPGHLPDLSIGTGDTYGMLTYVFLFPGRPLPPEKKLHKLSATSPNPDYIHKPPDAHNAETPATPPVSQNPLPVASKLTYI